MSAARQTFDPAAYGAIALELLSPPRRMDLGPGRPNPAVRERLAQLTPAGLLAPARVKDGNLGTACLAGLWLYHDLLDESHAVSQELHTAEGSYWHGTLHRREPDADNAKYWFRRVGRHAVFEPLWQAAAERAAQEAALPRVAEFLPRQTAWDPLRWIDLCEAARTGQVACVELCRDIAQREWELLFDYCWRGAVGKR